MVLYSYIDVGYTNFSFQNLEQIEQVWPWDTIRNRKNDVRISCWKGYCSTHLSECKCWKPHGCKKSSAFQSFLWKLWRMRLMIESLMSLFFHNPYHTRFKSLARKYQMTCSESFKDKHWCFLPTSKHSDFYKMVKWDVTSSVSAKGFLYTSHHKQINIKQIHTSDCLKGKRPSQICSALKKNGVRKSWIQSWSQWLPSL